MRPALFPPVALFVGACTGAPEEEPPPCTEFNVLVTVLTPMGDLVDDAEVEFTVVLGGEVVDTPCSSNGDGTYLCVGNPESDNQQVSALPTGTGSDELAAAAVKVQAPETCDETVEVTLYLGSDGMA